MKTEFTPDKGEYDYDTDDHDYNGFNKNYLSSSKKSENISRMKASIIVKHSSPNSDILKQKMFSKILGQKYK
jgi:hypothetical protein